jgi:hypothetical protein
MQVIILVVPFLALFVGVGAILNNIASDYE